MMSARRNYPIILLVCVFCIGICVDSIQAQDDENVKKAAYWFNVGLGLSTAGSTALSANGSLRINKTIFSVRTTQVSEAKDQVGGGEFFDVGILIGTTASVTSNKLIALAVGLARVTGYRYVGEPGRNRSVEKEPLNNSIGIPLEIQMFYRPNHIFGIGFYIFGNFNSEQSFGGITLSIQFGQF